MAREYVLHGSRHPSNPMCIFCEIIPFTILYIQLHCLNLIELHLFDSWYRDSWYLLIYSTFYRVYKMNIL